MMAHKGAILIKYKDKLIPEDLLKNVLDAYKSCWGASLILEQDGQKKLFSDVLDSTPSLEDVMKTQSEMQGRGMVFYFGDFPQGFQSTDMQPHTVLYGPDNEALVTAFLSGDFSNFSRTDSNHLPEYHLVMEELIPKFQQLYRLTGEKMDKFMDELRSPNVKKELLRLGLNEDTLIVLFASVGEIMTFTGRDDRVFKFPWGWTSDLCEPQQETAPPPRVEAKAETAAPAFSLSRSKAPEVKTTATAVPQVKQTEDNIKVGPPPQHLTNKEKKKWWRNIVGYEPNDYKNGTVSVPRSKIKDFKLLGIATGTVDPSAAPEAAPAPETAPSPEAPQVQPEEKKETAVPQPIPVLSNTDKEKIGAQFFKAIDANSQKIPDPATMQAQEKEYPTFASQTGKEMNEILALSYQSLVKLGKEVSVEALAILCKDMMNIVRARQAAAPDNKKAEETTPTTAPASKVSFSLRKAG